MRKIEIAGIIFLVGLLIIFYTSVSKSHRRLYETVKADFTRRHPDYQFIGCEIGEGDLVVSYVHVRFGKPGDDEIQEEVWQYWDADSAWLHRDKYLDLIDKNEP